MNGGKADYFPALCQNPSKKQCDPPKRLLSRRRHLPLKIKGLRGVSKRLFGRGDACAYRGVRERHLPPNFFGFVDEMPGMPEEFPAATA